jgi:hypothetical protein
MENDVKTDKEKMKKDLRKQKEINKRFLQNLKVRYPSHTTNV